MTPDGADELAPREGSRVSLFMLANITFEPSKGFLPVRVRNLSAGGIMVESGRMYAPGHPAICEIKGIGEIPGVVAWASGGRMGIRFDVEVDPNAARMTPAKADKDESLFHRLISPGRRPGLAIR